MQIIPQPLCEIITQGSQRNEYVNAVYSNSTTFCAYGGYGKDTCLVSLQFPNDPTGFNILVKVTYNVFDFHIARVIVVAHSFAWMKKKINTTYMV